MLASVKNGPALSATTTGFVFVGPRFVQPCWETSSARSACAPMNAIWMRM